MSAAPAVSVVIPAYCGHAYLNEALASVRGQTFADHETIVVDDCSGDECVSHYELGGDVRLIVHSERRGPAAARNTGIRESRGRYIALMDMDDVWLPEKLERQVEVLDRSPVAGLAFCHYTLADENLRPTERQPAPKKVGKSAFRRLLAGNIIKSCSVVMLRREAIDRCGGFDEALLGPDDWDLWLRIAHDYEICADPTPLALYRVHPAQLSRDAAAMRSAEVRVMRKWLSWVESHDPSIAPLVRGHLCRRLCRLASAQARDGDVRGSLDTLRSAKPAGPWNVRRRVWPAVVLGVALRSRLRRGALRPD
jgi:glycosyltransferase involved in cell wall biosynthesis